MKIAKIISGGQTGVDRAALDVALELGIPCGGWCPKGRRAEDGAIPDKYPVEENDSPEYPPRTARNVRAADGTLILTRGTPDRGTALTVRIEDLRQAQDCVGGRGRQTPIFQFGDVREIDLD
jgi:Circularly permutated YpsA SLOG family